jgi:hypothetical protein
MRHKHTADFSLRNTVRRIKSKPIISPWQNCQPVQIVTSNIELTRTSFQKLKLGKLFFNDLKNMRRTLVLL